MLLRAILGYLDDPMKKYILSAVALLAFVVGFTASSIFSHPTKPTHSMKVTGIGGIFFKSKDPHAMKEWYNKHLGIEAGAYGATFEWYQQPDSTVKGVTTWNPFKETTTYFEPSKKDFMVNYRVDDLEGMVEAMKKDGVTICDSIETVEYGKFVHIMDPEGNKIELWEPK